MKDFVCGEKAKNNQEQTFFLCVEDLFGKSMKRTILWPRVHKAFQNQDQDQAQVKNSSTTFIKPTIII